MLILYEENEKKFETLGLGILKDAISANVKEELNEAFELEMSYPVSGKLFNELRIDRIICCKTNPYDSVQPFRIYSITKPLNGKVTVNANHISYDMNGIPVTAINGDNLSDIINKIQNGYEEEKMEGETVVKVHKKCTLLDNSFNFNTDIFSAKTFKTTAPYSLRALLMGGEESMVGVYDGELKFDKFTVSILQHRGRDRGARVVYGHNMTDLNHEIISDNLYNGIFPYYHSEKTSTETSTSDEFKKVYIVGTKPFASDWLSYTEGGESFIPVSEAPIQIGTEGEHFEKIYAWNQSAQRYEEKIYNEQVNLIQGIFEPSWISIDWSKFPKVTAVANKIGYYKKSTDATWGDKKGVGDVIFSESLISGGIMENIMLCFSEVIPSDSNSENTEVSEIIDVILDDPIMKVETQDTRNMLHDRILNVDLSSEFEEAPTKDQLRTKAEEYIKKNKIGIIKHNTTVSFVDLASTTEHDIYKNFDHIELGDSVSVVYQDLGVDVKLRVISTDYDVLTDRYDSVELGEKEDKMSSSNVQVGDSVSSLSNDMGYTDVTTVNKLIAQTVTAEYLEAVNARLSKAAIKQLEAERINVSGILEASQFNLDTLVAKLLTADNAEIKKTLKAGKIEVAGDITVKSGEISIESEDKKTSFYVDRDGNLTANSVEITGGNFNIGNGNFMVENDGTMYAKNAEIEGTITATSGKIADFYIIKSSITTDSEFDPENPDPEYKPSAIYITPNIIKAGANFSVTKEGEITANKGTIGPLSIIESTGSFGQKKLVYVNSSGKEIFAIDPSMYTGTIDPANPSYDMLCSSIYAQTYISPTYQDSTSDKFARFVIDYSGFNCYDYQEYYTPESGENFRTKIIPSYYKNIPILLSNDNGSVHALDGKRADLNSCYKIFTITAKYKKEDNWTEVKLTNIAKRYDDLGSYRIKSVVGVVNINGGHNSSVPESDANVYVDIADQNGYPYESSGYLKFYFAVDDPPSDECFVCLIVTITPE